MKFLVLRPALQKELHFLVSLGITKFHEFLRGVLFIVREGSDIYEAYFMHNKRTTFLTKMKISIDLEELK